MSQEYCIVIKKNKRRSCVEPDCKSSARDKTDKCIAHGGGARCVEPDCKSSAQGKSGKCIAHGGGARCVEPDCKSSAICKTDKCVAHSIGKTDKCKRHGGGAKCVEPDCKASAQGKSGKCIAHGGGARCPNCIDWLDSLSGSSAYEGYCATCFKVIFPNNERSKVIYRHTKEIMVRNIINHHFDGFIHDIPLYTGNCDCTHRRRIDHRRLIGNTMLAIETDEFGHRGYDKQDEEIRYDDLFMIHSGKWIFIRFNPDTNVSKIDIQDKLVELVETIKYWISRIEKEENMELIEIIKLYC